MALLDFFSEKINAVEANVAGWFFSHTFPLLLARSKPAALIAGRSRHCYSCSGVVVLSVLPCLLRAWRPCAAWYFVWLGALCDLNCVI